MVDVLLGVYGGCQSHIRRQTLFGRRPCGRAHRDGSRCIIRISGKTGNQKSCQNLKKNLIVSKKRFIFASANRTGV